MRHEKRNNKSNNNTYMTIATILYHWSTKIHQKFKATLSVMLFKYHLLSTGAAQKYDKLRLIPFYSNVQVKTSVVIDFTFNHLWKFIIIRSNRSVSTNHTFLSFATAIDGKDVGENEFLKIQSFECIARTL